MKLEKTCRTAKHAIGTKWWGVEFFPMLCGSRRKEASISYKQGSRYLGSYGGLRTNPARQSGSVMLEFVIAFPIVLVLMFACIQFSQIWIARMVVHYGAFCAARSALVCRSDEYLGNNSAPSRAATNVCWLLQQKWGIASIPSNDRNLTDVSDDGWNVKATHTFQFSLITPIVGDIIAFGMTPWHEDPKKTWLVPENRPLDGLKYPFITLTETVVLPKPYHTMVEARFRP